jgi:hypothetical protein
MDILPPKPVKLNAKEKKLFASIDFDIAGPIDHEELETSCRSAAELAKSLVNRKAIPAIRKEWFEDAEFNPGSRGKSRKSVFEMNGTRGDAIYSHPHFLPHLWYFINGPKLPAKTISSFCDILNHEILTTGGMMDRLSRFVRAQVRAESLDRGKAGDEFYKLAIETDQERFADTLRRAAMNTR